MQHYAAPGRAWRGGAPSGAASAAAVGLPRAGPKSPAGHRGDDRRGAGRSVSVDWLRVC